MVEENGFKLYFPLASHSMPLARKKNFKDNFKSQNILELTFQMIMSKNRGEYLALYEQLMSTGSQKQIDSTITGTT